MKHFSSFLVITLFFVVNSGFSQVKREVEERISLEKLPNPIKSLLPIIKPNAKHLKFYHEIDGEKESYELKFKKEKTLFSLEFNKAGALEDIEVLISTEQLPKAIIEALNPMFIRYKLVRIQKQFLPTGGESPKRVIERSFENSATPKAYEIGLFGKTEKENKQFEFLFDPLGNILDKRTLMLPNQDHVIY